MQDTVRFLSDKYLMSEREQRKGTARSRGCSRPWQALLPALVAGTMGSAVELQHEGWWGPAGTLGPQGSYRGARGIAKGHSV